MKKLRLLAALALALCLVLGLSGCDKNVKDNVLDGFDRLLESISKNALTKPVELQGEKISGGNAYIGSYSAEYEGFCGEEILFGGTCLNRENRDKLTVTYTIKTESGVAVLVWVHSGDESTVVASDGSGTYEITIKPGDNYIVLRGRDFDGSFKLEVK